MVDSCRWSSACLCVLWSYNKRWSNGIIISYMYPLYTLPHGTPTWDNFRGAETRNNMNPVCHCTGQCNVKDVGTWSAGEVINPWKRRRACFGIENTNVSDCMMFPQFVPERLPILKKNTSQFPMFQPLLNLRSIVMEKCRPSGWHFIIQMSSQNLILRKTLWGKCRNV